MKLSMLLGMLMCAWGLSAQQPVRQVVAAMGGFNESDGYTSSSTIGEAVIFTTASDLYILTQGFQQPDELDLITGLNEPIQDLHVIRLFPNPCMDQATLEIEGLDILTSVIVSVFSSDGKLVKYWETGLPVDLDLKNEKPGIYLVVVKTEAGTYLGSRGIIKQ